MVVFNHIAPFKSKPVKRTDQHQNKSKPSPWLTIELVKVIKLEDQLYRKYKAFPFNLKLKQRYQKHQNLATKLIREAKAEFYSIKITEAINNSKKLWET